MLSTHPLRRTAAAAGAVVALVLAAFLMAAAPATAAVTGSLPLHNDTAEATKDCPADGYAYWHFVLSPNDGSSAFVTIVLSLDGDLVTFEGDAIVPNHGQTDNVYVGVPAGSTLTSLEAEGSYATYLGGDPTHFNLSHVCEGTVPTTTTPPTVPPTEPTIPPTEPTIPPTQPTVPTPTDVEAEVLGTTMVNVATGELPYTGSDELGLAAIGLAVAGAGFALATIARRRQQV